MSKLKYFKELKYLLFSFKIIFEFNILFINFSKTVLSFHYLHLLNYFNIYIYIYFFLYRTISDVSNFPF